MKRSEPKLIGDVLREFFERPYVARQVAEGKLPEYWREIVGEHIAALTTEFRYERGILYIGISLALYDYEQGIDVSGLSFSFDKVFHE